MDTEKTNKDIKYINQNNKLKLYIIENTKIPAINKKINTLKEEINDISTKERKIGTIKQ